VIPDEHQRARGVRVAVNVQRHAEHREQALGPTPDLAAAFVRRLTREAKASDGEAARDMQRDPDDA
jgi:hypothetical protein